MASRRIDQAESPAARAVGVWQWHCATMRSDTQRTAGRGDRTAFATMTSTLTVCGEKSAALQEHGVSHACLAEEVE